MQREHLAMQLVVTLVLFSKNRMNGYQEYILSAELFVAEEDEFAD